MRIVHVVYSFRIGGLETMLVDIMRLQARTDEVHFVLVNDVADQSLIDAIDPKVHIHRLNRKPGSRNPWPILKLNTLILNIRPNIVHIHQGSLAKYIKVGPNPFLTVHDLGIELDSKARKTHIITISNAVAKDLMARYPSIRIDAVAPNGIDTDIITSRTNHPLSTPARLVQVARFDIEKKGQDILIEAIRILKNRGYQIDLTLIGGANFENIPILEKQARDAGLTDCFHIIPGLDRNKLYSTLREFDMMVHPARWEGFGLVIAEGMAAGLPVIIPSEGGPYEVADHGRLAEVFKNGDARDCADAIARVIDSYPTALDKAIMGREHVMANYSLNRMVEQYRTAYLKTVNL